MKEVNRCLIRHEISLGGGRRVRNDKVSDLVKILEFLPISLTLLCSSGPHSLSGRGPCQAPCVFGGLASLHISRNGHFPPSGNCCLLTILHSHCGGHCLSHTSPVTRTPDLRWVHQELLLQQRPELRKSEVCLSLGG